jgi:hypothetical protein
MGIIGSRLVSNFSFPWLNFHLLEFTSKNCEKEYRTLAWAVIPLYLPNSDCNATSVTILWSRWGITGSQGEAIAAVCVLTSAEIAGQLAWSVRGAAREKVSSRELVAGKSWLGKRHWPFSQTILKVV